MKHKLIAVWSQPPEESADEFASHYASAHVQLASRLPHLERFTLVIARPSRDTDAISRVAELVFPSEEQFRESVRSPEWAALQADAEYVQQQFGVVLKTAVGAEHVAYEG